MIVEYDIEKFRIDAIVIHHSGFSFLYITNLGRFKQFRNFYWTVVIA